MNEKIYTALRVLRPLRKGINDFPEFTKELYERARQHLEEDDQFQRYLEHIRNGDLDIRGHRNLGSFQLVRATQVEITKIPKDTLDAPGADDNSAAEIGVDIPVRRQSTRPRNRPDYYHGSSSGSSGSYRSIEPLVASIHTAASAQEGVVFQKAKDEQIVNEGINLLLKTLTMNIDDVRCQWTSHRTPFTSVKLGPEGSTKKLTALTDGYLEGMTGPRIFALVEAKAGIRQRSKRPEVLWQEAAEIVAWIMTDSSGSYPNCLNDIMPNKGRGSYRMLISQDRHEIFISIASYSATYMEYLKGTQGEHGDFLTVYEYGPWDIRSSSNMEHFANLIVQFCMAVSEDDKKDSDIEMSDD
ncbi:hypothetical protein PENDEC_c039G03703 [Penicillium decumbens]|uniref:Uncharacterized protein n=1 Tax=Penicillium decumbens TaxID=69771 RepID=A0A1V6NRP9_PENDC|nr:hypothetical protein PENDEC_c039G03703 [Penicillium decumbens]